MNILKTIVIALLLVVGIVLIHGCDESKFNLDSLPDPGEVGNIGDTNYIEILPPYGGFQKPVSITIGNDQLIYIADYDANEIVMMDASGAVLHRRSVPHPVTVVQNLKLDLYVCGETIAPNNRDTISALYKISLVRFDTIINGVDTSIFYNHDLANAPMRIVRREPDRPKRTFVGLGFMPDNSYMLSRTGPDNSSVVDPDARVLEMDNKDRLVTPRGEFVTRASGGNAITDINQLSGLTVFPSSRDFIVLQADDGIAYGAIWMVYRSSPEFIGWTPKFDPAVPEQRIVDFIRPNRYHLPTAAAIDRRRRDIFIIDADLDSVSKFDRNGNFKSESFGKYRTATNGLPGLNHPMGITFSNDCTLYIADTGNRLIRRFKLSLQTQCN